MGVKEEPIFGSDKDNSLVGVVEQDVFQNHNNRIGRGKKGLVINQIKFYQNLITNIGNIFQLRITQEYSLNDILIPPITIFFFFFSFW